MANHHKSWDQAPAVNEETLAVYRRWKQRFLKQGPCGADALYVDASGDAGEPNDITVSEAHGYGMLLLATLAAHDTEAQGQFDRLVTLLRRQSVSEGLPLMTWRIDAACEGGNARVSAPDGDMDIAYALLLADAQWGSSESFPYKKLATERIHALMDHIVQDANGPTPHLALWEHIRADDAHYNSTRLSDLMPNHFRAFYAATRDVRWLNLMHHGYKMLDELQTKNASGFVPDFAVLTAQGPAPAPKNFLENDLDGSFYYNACRLPWRLAIDASPDERARRVACKMANALVKVSSGKPEKLVDGYHLDSTPAGPKTGRLAFLGPAALLLSACPETKHLGQSWQAYTMGPLKEQQSYYNETLRVLSLVHAGAWPGEPPPPGHAPDKP